MRITRKLRGDQETIKRFLSVLGGGMLVLSSNKLANPGFFILAHGFIHEYIENRFFKKEELLIKVLEDSGFPTNEGPIGGMRTEQNKSREAADLMINAASQWKTGDESARAEVGWAASEYTSIFRKHLERLKNLIFPLLEQNIPIEEEHKLAARFDTIVFDDANQDDPDKYTKLIETLEEELSDWK